MFLREQGLAQSTLCPPWGCSHRNITYPSVVAKSRFHKLLGSQGFQLPAEFEVPCVRLLEGAVEGLPQDQVRVLNAPHVLTSGVHEAISIT